ncbi:hypothetical protein [Parafrankia sp. Ea1.12]|uniref:hypothetical protein n=1 Tax=Parafrankia sp. Ea1.12 TaxID=573499 RepID=UPI000DD34F6F|nr:hypothetical protein [Parafrankia sp. Ea1.12]
MRTVFDGDVYVHCRQIYVQSGPDVAGPESAFPGQVNGLCGAALPGWLHLVTGLHAGRVGFTVQVHESVTELAGD